MLWFNWGVIIQEKCINCEIDYSQELKYCPKCGTKNPHFIESDQIITEFKRDIGGNTYFESKVEKEIKKLTKNLGNKSFYKSSKSNSSKGINSGSPSSKSSFTKRTNGGLDTSKSSSGIGKTKTSNIPKRTKDVICPNCRAENDNSSNFCINCGLNLNEVKICPKCGYLSTFAKYCTDCGTPLKKFK